MWRLQQICDLFCILDGTWRVGENTSPASLAKLPLFLPFLFVHPTPRISSFSSSLCGLHEVLFLQRGPILRVNPSYGSYVFKDARTKTRDSQDRIYHVVSNHGPNAMPKDSALSRDRATFPLTSCRDGPIEQHGSRLVVRKKSDAIHVLSLVLVLRALRVATVPLTFRFIEFFPSCTGAAVVLDFLGERRWRSKTPQNRFALWWLCLWMPTTFLHL